MTAVHALIAEVRRHGGGLKVEAGVLYVAGLAALPGELLAAIRAHKPELLKLLRPRPYHGWLVSFPDRLLVAATPPDETAAELLRTYPDALHAMRLPYVEAEDHAHAA